jgi:tetratricopeptide (TPR) repeat protein
MNIYKTSAILFIFALLAIPVVNADNFVAIQHYNQAVDLANTGNYQEALNEVDLALTENPNFTLALITKGGILNVLGRYQEAIEVSDRAIALDPREAAAWNNEAYALIHLGDYNKGLTAAQKATELDPNLTEAWVNEGTALIRLGRFQEALAASEKALSLDPSSPEAKLNRNEALTNLQTPTTAAPLSGICVLCGIALAGILVCRGWRSKNR